MLGHIILELLHCALEKSLKISWSTRPSRAIHMISSSCCDRGILCMSKCKKTLGQFKTARNSGAVFPLNLQFLYFFILRTNLVPRVRDSFGVRQGSWQDAWTLLAKVIVGSGNEIACEQVLFLVLRMTGGAAKARGTRYLAASPLALAFAVSRLCRLCARPYCPKESLLAR